MTTAIERHLPGMVSPEPNGEVQDASLLDQMIMAPTSELQVDILRHAYFAGYRQPEERQPQLAEELVAVAAEGGERLPTIVRLEALDFALRKRYLPAFNRHDSDVFYMDVAIKEEDYSIYPGEAQHKATGYRYVSKALLEETDIDTEIYFPPVTQHELDRGKRFEDYNPSLSLIYLDGLDQELKGATPSPEAQRFAPLITELKQTLSAHHGLPKAVDVPLYAWQDVAVCAKLFKYGDHYPRAFAEFMDSAAMDRLAYIQTIGEIYQTIPGAAAAYPKRYYHGVRHGMENLLADAAYAVNNHLANGLRTKAALPLRGGSGELRLESDGDEPLRLLRALHTALLRLEHASAYTSAEGHKGTPSHPDPYRPNLLVSKSKDYRMYRFVEKLPGGRAGVLPVHLYVRPYGSVNYDSKLEYGRSGEGVEASINYVIDISEESAGLVEIGKHQGMEDDRRISIRLDREGVKSADRQAADAKDPTQREGTLSLDVGSVLGRDEWTSTRLGRFLAWGNVLRTHAEGRDPHLNHMTDYFGVEDADAHVFALQAAQMIELLAANTIDTEGLKRLFAGRTALKGVSQ